VTLPLFDATPPGQIVARSTPVASPAVSTVTRPASPSEQVEITSAVDVIVACMNTGNPAQTYGIFSDRYLAAMFADPAKAYLPAFEQSLAGATIPEIPPYTLTSAGDISFLENGSAEVTITIARGSESWTSTLILVRDGNVWLIDGVVS
jgi:hypothetical protein